MKMNFNIFLVFALTFLAGCAAPTTPPPTAGSLRALAVETFLADITQQVGGERIQVESLVPLGMDPHAFQPVPQDVKKIAESQVLVLNGAGFEEWARETIENAGGERLVIEASKGLTSRTVPEGEHPDEEEHEHEGDPHFWMDPVKVIHYVENIRDGLTQADPQGKETYEKNAASYIAQLKDLDAWIEQQVSQIPAEKRLIVTNHESFGYFADRYGFKIIGAIIPSVSTGASPSARDLAQLIEQIKSTGVRAIFVESGASTELAQQISEATGAQVISDLYTHSLTGPDGEAFNYIAMMKHNTRRIVEVLK